MALTLYVETNFPIGIAKGEYPAAAEFLEGDSTDVQIVIPGVCFMEAFSVWNMKRKQNGELVNRLSAHLKEMGQNSFSTKSDDAAEHLRQSIMKIDDLFNNMENRFDETLRRLSEGAEIINLENDGIKDALTTKRIADPTDNLAAGAP